MKQENEIISTKKYKALIIDDSEMNREILKGILSDEMDIVEIDNGEDACDYMMNHASELNIVILDLVMPGMNGFETLEKLKAGPCGDIRVCMMSGTVTDEVRQKASQLGAVGVIGKPLDAAEVLGIING